MPYCAYTYTGNTFFPRKTNIMTVSVIYNKGISINELTRIRCGKSLCSDPYRLGRVLRLGLYYNYFRANDYSRYSKLYATKLTPQSVAERDASFLCKLPSEEAVRRGVMKSRWLNSHPRCWIYWTTGTTYNILWSNDRVNLNLPRYIVIYTE